MYSVQQPQQKLLSIVLSIAFELGGVFRHGVLQQTMWPRDYKAFKVKLSNFTVISLAEYPEQHVCQEVLLLKLHVPRRIHTAQIMDLP